MLAIVLITGIFFAYLIYREYNIPDTPPLTVSLPLDFVFLLSQLIVFLLSQKVIFFRLNFSNIQVILFHVLLLELSVAANTRAVYAYTFKEIPVVFLCKTSYNQVTFSVCLGVCYIYTIIRAYFWVDDLYIFSILVIEYFFFFTICILTSKLTNKKERALL